MWDLSVGGSTAMPALRAPGSKEHAHDTRS
jgi:hypothetical protein